MMKQITHMYNPTPLYFVTIIFENYKYFRGFLRKTLSCWTIAALRKSLEQAKHEQQKSKFNQVAWK